MMTSDEWKCSENQLINNSLTPLLKVGTLMAAPGFWKPANQWWWNTQSLKSANQLQLRLFRQQPISKCFKVSLSTTALLQWPQEHTWKSVRPQTHLLLKAHQIINARLPKILCKRRFGFVLGDCAYEPSTPCKQTRSSFFCVRYRVRFIISPLIFNSFKGSALFRWVELVSDRHTEAAVRYQIQFW